MLQNIFFQFFTVVLLIKIHYGSGAVWFALNNIFKKFNNYYYTQTPV
jgi:hypothetical protein